MAKHVLITGASQGIGAAAARVFAREGWKVAVNYHSSWEEAQALVRELCGLGGRAVPIQADVSDPGQAEALVREAEAALGPLDAVVCNAGVALPQQLLTDTTGEQWRSLMAVDLDGVFYCCQAALPPMLHRKEGRIVTLSSMWGQVGASCEVAFSAAKAGVIGLTKALAKEVAPSGITVNCVAPGVVDTDMVRPLGEETLAALAEETPLGRLGTAEDVAGCVSFLCSPGGAFLTGQVIAPNGGLVI